MKMVMKRMGMILMIMLLILILIMKMIYDTFDCEGGGWLEGFKDDVASTIFGDCKLHSDVPVWTKEEIPGKANPDQGGRVVT